MYCLVGGEALSRAEPPAGPPKFDLLVADATFPEIPDIFGIMPETVLPREFAQTIESTQRVHHWIAFTLMKGGKLLPSETNT